MPKGLGYPNIAPKEVEGLGKEKSKTPEPANGTQLNTGSPLKSWKPINVDSSLDPSGGIGHEVEVKSQDGNDPETLTFTTKPLGDKKMPGEGFVELKAKDGKTYTPKPKIIA